jgi:Putative peptidoglycan binding domain
MKTLIWICFGIALTTFTARADLNDILFDRPHLFFHNTDALAPRDEWGLVHQSRTTVYDVEFAKHYTWRPLYYFQSGRQLVAQPAYVGALQRDLTRLGYYCGPIDGVYTVEVAEAIAALQKNYSMRVTGTLAPAVRRVLHLP